MKLKKVIAFLIAMCILATLAFPVSAYAAATTVDVTSYGANGSDKADDRDAIQKALDLGKSATAANPLIVKIPAGTYYLRTSLSIYSNTTLQLDKNATLVRADDSHRMLGNGGEDTKTGKYGQLKNVTITGGTWDGNVSGKSGNIGNLFTLWHGENITISDTTMKGCRGNHYIEVAAVKDFTVKNVKFTNFVEYSGTVFDYTSDKEESKSQEASPRSEAIQLEYAAKENCEHALPYDGTACTNVTIEGCSFDGSPSAIGNHHWDKQSSNITIKNNTFTNLKASCINIPNMKNVTITGNTATNVGSFVRASNGTTATVSGNTIKFSKTSVSSKLEQDMYYVNNSTVTVNNDKVYGVGKRAVYATGSNANVTLSGVTFDLSSFRPNAYHALHFDGGCKATVTNCTITKAAKSAILVNKASITATGNTISGNAAENSIYLEAATAGTVSKNTIKSAPAAGIRLLNCTASAITVSGNTIETPKTNAINAKNSKVNADGNTITGTKDNSIYFDSVTGGSASNNKISNSAQAGIRVVNSTASNISLNGNTISNSTTHGISVQKSKVTVNNNNISGFGSDSFGIYMDGATFTISNNTVSGKSGQYAIRTKDSADGKKASGTVQYNTVSGKGINTNSSTGGVTVKAILGTPKVSSLSGVANGVQISWGKVSGAASYRVFYKTGSGGWTKAGDTTSTSYTWTGAKKGTKYSFTVRCITADGKTYTSNYDTTGKSITFNGVTKLATPKISAVSNDAKGVKVTWGSVSGAAKYRVFYKTGSGGWTKAGDTTSTSYTWTGAKGNTKYTFTVRCISGDGKTYTSDFDATGKSTIFISAPKISAISNETKGVKITWGKVSGAAKYRVFYKSGSSGWKQAGDTASTSYTWTGAKSGTKYTFTVRCISKDGKSYASGFDATGKGITFIAAPKLSSVSKTSSGIQIKWGKVTGAANYCVFRKTGNGKWTKITTTTSTSYVDKTAKKGTTYSYTVRCVSKDGKSYTSGYDATGKSIKK
ncbi:MAG: right-handed parallel beta-helix repeat-containing protein [Eubacterium sp.]|nr:right-handed parallel beta-helix repeat-containing protein [Eubacterium sp.]